MDILGTSPFSEKQVNAFMEHKGCPRYAQFYRVYGEKYGVRWDVAVCQSMHETGFWNFGKDVKREQNNFAGLGATGGGEPGASFFNAEVGILAQIQHLAIYAGVDIPTEKLTYDRTKKLVEWGKKGTAKTFEALAGKWARDKKYGQSISIIYAEMRDFIATLPKEDGDDNVKNTDESVTWLEFNCTNDGKPAITAYEESTPKFTRFPKNRHDVDEFMKAFPNAEIKVPDTSVKVIPRCPDFGEEKPDPVKPRPNGKRVLLDPGHSERHVGARGKNSSVQEEDLNRYQAECLKEELEKYGIHADIIDPIDDDLWAIGKAAQGYDAFVSLHLNAYKGREFYTTAMCHSRLQSPGSKSAKVASEWAIETANAIGNPIFSGTKGWPKGVMAAGLSVLNGAANTNCPIAFLSELEFIDDETENGPIMQRIKKGMKVGAKVLADALA